MFSSALSSFLLVISLFLGSQATLPSPRASTELICHTNHASECYPKTFQAQPYFQKVHDDQELPPGLHVRMNLETGQKEAKLNDPNENDESVYDVAVIPSDPSPDAISESILEQKELPHGYAQAVLQAQSDGTIRPPPDGDDGSGFSYNQEKLNSASPETDPNILAPALDVLSDLAHDIYYGLQLSKDRSSIHKLIFLLGLNNTNHQIKASAAVVFGAAIQNNPAALSAALSHCYNDELPTGPMEAVIMALIHEQVPNILSRFIYLLSALSQDPAQLIKFINTDGMDLLLDVYNVSGAGHDDKEKLRIKIATFVLDHFIEKPAPESTTYEQWQEERAGDAASNLEDEEWVMLDMHDAKVNEDFTRLKDWEAVLGSSIESLRRNQNDQESLDNAQSLQSILDASKRKSSMMQGEMPWCATDSGGLQDYHQRMESIAQSTSLRRKKARSELDSRLLPTAFSSHAG